MATPRSRPYTTHFTGNVNPGMQPFCAADISSRASTSLSTPSRRPATRARSLPSSVSLPNISRTSQHRIAELSLGADARRSALRSLANNHSLSMRRVDGRVSIVSREYSTSPYLPNATNGEFPERILVVSSEGYHSRSHSPTYKTLRLARAQIEVLLSKKLREMGDCVDCLQDKEQSIERTPDKVRTHQTSCPVRQSLDIDDAVYLTDSERPSSGDHSSTRTHQRTVRFDSGVLRENRRNKAILELDEEDIAWRLQKWKDKYSTNIPILERQDDPEVNFTRPCQRVPVSEDVGKGKFIFLRRTSRRVAPAVPVRKRPKDTKRKPKPKENESTREDDKRDESLRLEETFSRIVPISLSAEMKADSPKQDQTVHENAWKGQKSSPPKLRRESDYDRIKALINRENSQSEKSVSNSIDPNSVAESPEQDQPRPTAEDVKPLTAKEKFIRIQDRMADIKRAKRETMTSFADYSYLMINKRRTQTHLEQLGSSLSKRLEKMSVFQSRERDSSDDESESGDLLLDVSEDEGDSDDEV